VLAGAGVALAHRRRAAAAHLVALGGVHAVEVAQAVAAP
jgi:hypothetical protein